MALLKVFSFRVRHRVSSCVLDALYVQAGVWIGCTWGLSDGIKPKVDLIELAVCGFLLGYFSFLSGSLVIWYGYHYAGCITCTGRQNGVQL